MLGKLFGSNARVNLLKLFLMHPEKKYYIRQIARDLKLQLNSVRRELENMEEFGLLYSSVSSGEEEVQENGEAPGGKEDGGKQEKKYYQANPNFLLFDEIRNLIVKAQFLHKDEFIEKIRKAGKVKLLLFTGIFSGNINAPVDILVVGRFEKKERVYRLIRELEKDMGRELNYTLMDQREFTFRRDMTDVFLFKILEGKKVMPINEYGLI